MAKRMGNAFRGNKAGGGGSAKMSKAGRYAGKPKGTPPRSKGVGKRKPTASAPQVSGGYRPPSSNLKSRAAKAARRGGKAGRSLARRLTTRGK
jgi:hypothetical protein